MHLLDFKKNKDWLLAFAVALIALLAFRDFFGMRLLEFDALDKILFHSGKDADALLRIFTQPDGYTVYSIAYRPLPSLVWWILFQFNELNFTAFHAANFALHALNSVLVFALARKLFKDKSGFFSFTAAAVFALHPINLKIVLFVSRLPELMAAFFLLASLLSLIAFFERKQKRFFFLAVALCFFGILSKEAGALIPFVLFFYCIVFLQEKGLRRLLQKSSVLCAPFFSLIALYAVLMFFSLGSLAGYIKPMPKPRMQIVLTFFSYLFYFPDFFAKSFFNELFAFLRNQSADLLLLTAFTALAFAILRFFSKQKESKNSLFLFFWLFSFLFAFAAFSFLHVWYAYIPLVPFSLLLALSLKSSCKKFNGKNIAKINCVFTALLLFLFVFFSPLFSAYQHPLIASEITQSVLSQTKQAAAQLPPNSTVFLLNYPQLLVFSENGPMHSTILLNETSIQAFTQFAFPGKKLKVVSLASSSFFRQPLSSERFAFTQQSSDSFLIENNFWGVGRIYVSQERREKEEKGISLEYNRGDAGETIALKIVEEELLNAFFFFFDGKKVQVIKASEGS